MKVIRLQIPCLPDRPTPHLAAGLAAASCYARMFERMLQHPDISVLLNAAYREIGNLVPHRELVYTGPVDEYFDYWYGRLPYRQHGPGRGASAGGLLAHDRSTAA